MTETVTGGRLAGEFRVFGPPGTGKTTYLSHQIEQACVKWGNTAPLVTSLTRAAAREVMSRNVMVEDWRIGTLHSHAYRALKSPGIATDGKSIRMWNEAHPGLLMSAETDDLDGDALDPTADADLFADRLRERLTLLRVRMAPQAMWPGDVARFAALWTEFKARNGLVDFTDMIERALHEVPYPPGAPRVIFVDEAQDLDRLQMALLRSWAQPIKGVDRLVIVGDPDQNLYEWRGSDSDVFTTPALPPEQVRVLKQSWRVPRAVHAAAVRWITRCPGRVPVEYLPRDVEGDVRLDGTTWPEAYEFIPAIKDRVAAGQSVMVLASCDYMLRPLVQGLRDHGVPFHNPYRLKRGDWNPLRRGSEKRVTALDRLLAYMRPVEDVWGAQARDWTAGDVKTWSQPLTKLWKHGGRKAVEGWQPADREIGIDDLFGVFEKPEEAMAAYNVLAMPPDLDWYEQWLPPATKGAYRMALTVARKSAAELLKQPRVIVGTVHSVKGGEADCVYLFPDMSPAGYAQWGSGRSMASGSVYRLFYVGMTRARETLVLCAPASQRAVEWPVG